MGNLSAMAELRKENEKLREEIAELKPDYPTGFPIFHMYYHEMLQELSDMGIECRLKKKYFPDVKVPYTTTEAMAKIVPFLTYPADEYVYQGADCDDYAEWAATDASHIFKLGKGVFTVWGDMPLGKHAWCMTRVKIGANHGYQMFEPNAGFPHAATLFNVGAHGYQPTSWR